MRVLGLGVLLAALTACGIDGAPRAPESSASTGVSVGGDARIGIVGRP